MCYNACSCTTVGRQGLLHRAWAYSGAFEPMRDWDVVIADVDNVELLLELIGDETCPAREYLLDGLYCLFGHSDRTDPG